jgi:hypothetical protein
MGLSLVQPSHGTLMATEEKQGQSSEGASLLRGACPSNRQILTGRSQATGNQHRALRCLWSNWTQQEVKGREAP